MDTRHMYTVWRFLDLRDNPTIAVRAAELDDIQHQHHYQRVIWRGLAVSRDAALAAAHVEGNP